jgi:hypothetical protein
MEISTKMTFVDVVGVVAILMRQVHDLGLAAYGGPIKYSGTTQALHDH